MSGTCAMPSGIALSHRYCAKYPPDAHGHPPMLVTLTQLSGTARFHKVSATSDRQSSVWFGTMSLQNQFWYVALVLTAVHHVRYDALFAGDRSHASSSADVAAAAATPVDKPVTTRTPAAVAASTLPSHQLRRPLRIAGSFPPGSVSAATPKPAIHPGHREGRTG